MELLVADDDPAARLYLELALVSLHHTVAVANNGAEVLELLEQFQFDAVLLDVEMPMMGGVETLACIRANASLQDLPVYAITAHTSGPSLDAIKQASFTGYLAKPYGPRELEQLLSGEKSQIASSSTFELPIEDSEAFAEYQELLREAGLSPLAAVNRTLEAVGSWLAGQPECSPGSREEVHGLAGSCAVIGASSLREAMKNIERLAMAGHIDRWSAALAEAERILQDTRRIYRMSLSVYHSGQESGDIVRQSTQQFSDQGDITTLSSLFQ